jgi:NitT/TauT family transport system substrate-binding protein
LTRVHSGRRRSRNLRSAGNREYVRSYPVATKRVVRAILKAVDLCANDPARVARTIVDRRFTDRYDDARRR